MVEVLTAKHVLCCQGNCSRNFCCVNDSTSQVVVNVYSCSHNSGSVVGVVEAAMIGNVADVRSKILSSLVSQFGGQLKEGMTS